MRLLQTEKVSDTTLQNTITYISGNFAIGLEDPSRVAQYAINIERYHMPKDYYQNYLKNLAAVSSDDVMEMSKKYIRPDNANIVVAGSKDEVANKLARFSADGKIDYYDYSGKSVKPVETMAVPAGMTADDVFKKYVAAMGGEKGIRSVKDIQIVMTSEVQGTPIIITEMKKAPNSYKQVIDVSMNGQKMTVQKQVFNGTKGYQTGQGGQKADITGDDLDEIIEQADLLSDLHPEKYGIKRTLKGMESVNGSNAYVIDVINAKGKKSTEYYDATSALLVRKIQGEGEKSQTSDYADYQVVEGTDGFKVAHKVTESGAGNPTISATVQTVEVNKGIADTEFN